MMTKIFGNYQTRVIEANANVDYLNIVQGAYSPVVLANEQFIGIKALTTDTYTRVDAYGRQIKIHPAERIQMLEYDMVNSKFLAGTGCIIRETSYVKPDGFWVITLPVPKSNLNIALNKLASTLIYLHQAHSIECDGVYEINISGRCRSREELEWRLNKIQISKKLMNGLIMPSHSVYKLGHVEGINDEFIMFRTKWNLMKTGSQTLGEQLDDIIDISNAISSMYY